MRAVRPLVLLSNDDGYDAAGIIALRGALRAFADVVTVAPHSEQSAQSHAISLHRPLRHYRFDDDVHAIDGTPVDCVYVALFGPDLLPRRPDLCVSGINLGPNLAGDVVYSGTVAAAREAALRGVPSIAFSQAGACDPLSLGRSAKLASALCQRLLASVGEGTVGQVPLLNVNFPAMPPKGVRATRLGVRHYSEGVEVRDDPRGRAYYWIGGPGGPRHERVPGSDTEAVDDGFVSVTALQLDATHPEQASLAAHVATVPVAARPTGDDRA
ncbi:MAG: 5'/3'-nucleotidase SurE [Myxococcales bacterium]|nr:5'/3'-nucleotidase SurE [Myxococcales bacterium]